MPRRILLLLAAVLVCAAAAQADEDLEDLLTQVGESYATAYTSPLIHSFGANQNSGLFHTAAIPRTRLTFSVGLKFMSTHLNEDDQTFRRVIRDVELNDYLDLEVGDPGYGQTGDIVLEGPTVFGDEDTDGSVTAYVNGLPIYRESTIPGFFETRWVPLFAPEFSVGGVAGLRATVRWMPEVDLGSYGKSKYLGYGLQWSPSPFLPPLPVDVTVGFFKQEIDLGTVLETEATSIFLAASRGYGPATVYAGVAKESSTLKVNYVEETTDVAVDFEVDGDMEARFTLGATLDLGVKLNAEMGMGKLTVFNVGLMFGM